MNFKEIQDLIKLISKSNLTEFKYKKGDTELTVRTKKYSKTQQVVSSPAAPIVQIPSAAPAPQSQIAAPQESAPAPAPAAASGGNDKGDAADNSNLVEIKSPIVGTFYRSPSPDKPVFVKVGDRVEVGQVVCIVEAMKLFNEIESEVSGEVVKVVPEDASPVEYDQVLFLVDPSK